MDPAKNRSKIIGGSEIAAVLGIDPYTTPLKLWAIKTGEIPKDPENEYMELGRELEEFVARKFERKSGKKVRKDMREFKHKKYPYLVAHIDRWVVGGELLECKTASAYIANQWAGDDIPESYLCQVIWYLGILGMKKGHIACLIGGNTFVYKEIEFDQELFDKMVAKAVEFMEVYVKGNVPPMASFGDKDTLVAMYPESSEATHVLTGDDEIAFNQLVEERGGGKEQLNLVKAMVDEVENKLRQIIGEDGIVETGQYKVGWKSQNRTSIDIDKIKDDGVYDKYAVTKSIRVLRAITKKEKK